MLQKVRGDIAREIESVCGNISERIVYAKERVSGVSKRK